MPGFRHRLRRQPAFFWGVGLTLFALISIEISVNSLLLASRRAVLGGLRRGRIVLLWSAPRVAGGRLSVSPADLADWQQQASLFAGFAGFTLAPEPQALDFNGNRRVMLPGANVTSNLFATLEVQPVIGNVRLDASDAIAISDNSWRDLLGSDPNVIGSLVGLEGPGGCVCKIAAVMPKDFRFPYPLQRSTPGFWRLMNLRGASSSPREAHEFGVVGRLRDGVGLPAARAQMDAIAARLARLYPADRPLGVGMGFLEDEVDPAARQVLSSGLWVLALGALIAILNFTALIAADITSRRHELWVRAVLGAGLTRLWGGVVMEFAGLAAGACVLSLLFAMSLVRLLPEILTAFGIWVPLASPARLAWPAALEICAAAVALVALTTLAAAARSGGFYLDPGEGRFGPRSNTRHRTLPGGIATVPQVAAAVILVAACLAALARTTVLARVDLGPDPAHLFVTIVRPPNGPLLETSSRVVYWRHLLADAAKLPGVQLAAAASDFPPYGEPWQFRKSGRDPWLEGTNPITVTNGFFQVVGARLLAGRTFAGSDVLGAPPVAVVNRAMARRFWPGENPIGREIRPKGYGSFRIVGIVDDFAPTTTGYENGTWIVTGVQVPRLYIAAAQEPDVGGTVLLRSSMPLGVLDKRFHEMVSHLSPRPDISGAMQSLQGMWEASNARVNTILVLIVLTTILAVAVALFGLYSTTTLAMARSRRELAIRTAVGASPGAILKTAMAPRGAVLVCGAALGIAGAILLKRIVAHWFGAVASASFHTELEAAALVVASALVAIVIAMGPALARNPAQELRQE